MFNYWVGAGRIDVGFLGAAQIDRFGNINTTVIGDHDHPTTRLPGAGGAPEIAANAGRVIVIVKQSLRTFVEQLDFRTTAGAGVGGAGVTCVVTDLGVLEPDGGGELTLTELHPEATADQAREATGWDLRVREPLETVAPPSERELATLREMRAAVKSAA
jgi:glutaconate CoA-transferase subunit B